MIAVLEKLSTLMSSKAEKAAKKKAAEEKSLHDLVDAVAREVYKGSADDIAAKLAEWEVDHVVFRSMVELKRERYACSEWVKKMAAAEKTIEECRNKERTARALREKTVSEAIAAANAALKKTLDECQAVELEARPIVEAGSRAISRLRETAAPHPELDEQYGGSAARIRDIEGQIKAARSIRGLSGADQRDHQAATKILGEVRLGNSTGGVPIHQEIEIQKARDTFYRLEQQRLEKCGSPEGIEQLERELADSQAERNRISDLIEAHLYTP
jgi:hypothetical protein